MNGPGRVRSAQSLCTAGLPALTDSDKEKTRGPSWYQTRAVASPPISLAASESRGLEDRLSACRALPSVHRRVPESKAGCRHALPWKLPTLKLPDPPRLQGP